MLAGEEGSFAQFTIRERLPRILRTAVADVEQHYGWGQLEEAAVRAGAAELEKELLAPGEHEIRLVTPDEGDEEAVKEHERWSSHFAGRLPCKWTELSFLEAETYFYYRLLQLFRFHSTAVDHFHVPKRDSMEGCKEAARSVVSYTIDAIDAAEKASAEHSGGKGQGMSEEERAQVRFLLYCSLWGNRVDLSLFKNASDRSHAVSSIEALNVNMLADDTLSLVDILAKRGKEEGGHLDIILDNFGYELVTDLTLVTYLLERDIVAKVVLHTKAYPTFVSDSTTPDVHWIVEIFSDASYAGDAGVRFAAMLRQHMEAGRLLARAHTGFNDPKDYSEFHDTFLSKDLELSSSLLCILKGDLNYRRLVGDRMWNSVDSDFSAIVSDNFPCPTATLRTLKSQVSVGLANARDRVAQLEQNEKDTWRVCGKYGVIQLALPPS